MGTGRQYDEEFKKQAIKLGKEVGIKAAAEELGIPKGTLGTWLKKARTGEIDTGSGTRTPEESLNLAEQLQAANKRIKELEKLYKGELWVNITYKDGSKEKKKFLDAVAEYVNHADTTAPAESIDFLGDFSKQGILPELLTYLAII